MIKFYGVFQLVKVVKEDKTRGGDTAVYFTAASRRTDKESDFKLFKIFGKDADYMLRGLTKNNDGKYNSRKMFIEGYVETYMDTQDVACTADITPDLIPVELGILKKSLTIKAKTQIKVQRDTYVVKHVEYVDKQKDNGLEIIVNSALEDVEYGQENSSTTSQQQSAINKTTNEKNKILKDTLKDLEENAFTSVNIDEEI